MKLLTKYSRIYFVVAIPAVLIVSVVYYYLTIRVITNKADESLMEDKYYIVSQIEDSDKIVDLFLNLSDDYRLVSIDTANSLVDQFSTVMVFDEAEGEDEPYRLLNTNVEYNGLFYELTIRKSLVEYNSLVYSIMIIGLIFFGVLTLSLFLINRFLTQKLWFPFYKTLHILNEYSPDSKKVIEFDNTDIDEFRLLNMEVKEMTEKINADFFRQKQLIDLIAHETQTPLSIINANVDNIVQNETMPETEYESIHNIMETSSKLSKVIKSVLLLSKIENKQFEETESINMVNLFKDYFKEFEEQVLEKNIGISFNIGIPFFVDMHAVLANVLVSNLCQNAIRHNIQNGTIGVSTQINSQCQKELEIFNSGKDLNMQTSKLFEKFVKKSDHSDSTGLGLSISNEICKSFNLELEYSTYNSFHSMKIKVIR